MNTHPTPGANYDFNQSLFLCKTLLGNLRSLHDRQRAVRWLRRLSTPVSEPEEIQVRDQYMYAILIQLQNGELKDPFLQAPDHGALTKINQLDPGLSCNPDSPCASPLSGAREGEADLDWLFNLENTDTSDAQRPLIYEQSPDGGAFLASQPVPRCGAFCYLAVVTKAQDK